MEVEVGGVVEEGASVESEVACNTAPASLLVADTVVSALFDESVGALVALA